MSQWWELSTKLLGLHCNSKAGPNHLVKGIVSGTHARGTVLQKTGYRFLKNWPGIAHGSLESARFSSDVAGCT